MRDLFEDVPPDEDGEHQTDPRAKEKGTRRGNFPTAIEEQATFAYELVRGGRRSGIRDELADKFGHFVLWDEVCACAGQMYNVALSWYE